MPAAPLQIVQLAGPATVPPTPPIATAVPVGSSPASGPGLDVQTLSATFSHALAQGDGEYSVAVSMHPPELGEVRALLSLRGDILQVVLTPHQEVGHGALATALPTLRDHLASSGLQVDVSLGQPGPDSGRDQGPAPRSTVNPEHGRSDPSHRAPIDDTTTSPDPDPDARIHVVL